MNPNYYRNATLGLSLFVTGGNARIWLSGDEADPGFVIENFLTTGDFQDGDFGITLNAGEAALPTNVINGTSGDDSVENPDGNPLVGTADADAINGLAGNDELRGEAGDDVLDGGAGVDVLVGDLGNDNLYGGDDTDMDILAGHAGFDVLVGGEGVGFLSGGSDHDLLVGGSANDLLAGGAGMDVLQGGAGDDLLLGDATYTANNRSASFTITRGVDPVFTVDLVEISGTAVSADDQADELSGGAGNDVLDGGGGDDLLNGDDDDDILQGNTGNDTLRGGAGDDILFADPDNATAWDDELDGGDGNDQLRGGLGRDTLYGGSGNDELLGDNPDAAGFATGGDNDLLYGQDGDDSLGGGDGNDLLDGGIGADLLLGDAGNDQLIGGEGADQLSGGEGDDNLRGDAGADLLLGNDGDDTLDGGADNDELHGGSGNDRLFGNDGDDLLVGQAGVDILYGGAGADELQGGDDADTLDGGDGDDTLFGEAGADSLRGGAGNDYLITGTASDYADGGSGHDVLLGEAGDDMLVGGLGNDLLEGGDDNDTLVGGAGRDTLHGGEGNDLLFGGEGNDSINGGNGNDKLDGGTGSNLLKGGAGDDDYLINALSGQVEIDDTSGNDRIIFNEALGEVSLHFTKHDGDLYASAGGLQLKINDWAAATDFQLFIGSNPPLTHSEIEAEFSEPPQVAQPLDDQQAVEDSLFTYQVPQDSFVDPEGTPLTYQATLANGAPLPAWLGFDAATRTFSGTPLNEHVGELDIRVVATDADEMIGSDVFTLTVANTNDAPLLVHPLSDRRATSDFTFTYRIFGAMFADPDQGDVLTYTATLDNGDPLPAWLHFNPYTRVFSGNPDAGDTGSFAIRVTATDSANASVSDVFVVAVTSQSEMSAIERISNSVRQTNFLGFANGPVGDINGDGNDDVYASAYNHNYEGFVPVHSYVIYGSHQGIAANVGLPIAEEDMDLVHIAGREQANEDDGAPHYSPSAGVLFSGPLNTQPYQMSQMNDPLPRLVPLGDINGDGRDDIGLNFMGSDGFGSSAKLAGPYVIFGNGSDYGGAEVDMLSLSSTLGFEVTRTPGDDVPGVGRLKGIGDIDGDGVDDFLVGDGVDAGVEISGQYISPNPYFFPSTLVFGTRQGFPSSFNIDTAGGRAMHLGNPLELGIRTLDAKGDFNGDGRNDPVAIDTNNNAYVMLDKFDRNDIQAYADASAAGGPIFAIDERIYSADYMGDFNGDGKDDLLVITRGDVYRVDEENPSLPDVSTYAADPTFRLAHKAHVVFGFEATGGPIDLDDLDGSNGFVVDIPFRTIGSGGDVDGDGLADIVIVDDARSAHIVFGHAVIPGGVVQTSDLDGNVGMHLEAGNVYSADIRSDMNGDGFNDIFLGAPTNGFRGESYIAYGANFRQQATFDGSAGDDYVEVDASGNVLTGAGNDEVHATGAGTVVIKTGTGNDKLFLESEGTVHASGGPGDDEYTVGHRGPSPSTDFWKYYVNDTDGITIIRVKGANKGPGILYANLNSRRGDGPGNSLVMDNSYSHDNIQLRPGSLHITFGDAEYEIHLANMDHADVLGGRRDFDTFEFEDGVLTFEQLVALGFDIDGTADADMLTGTNLVDRMNGFGGNDTLSSGAGDDILNAGTGNDTVNGGDGDDLYHYAPGDGQDLVGDTGGNDTLLFATGIAADGLTAAVVGNDVVVSIAGGGQVRLKDWLLGPLHQIESFRFADDPEALLTSEDINDLAGTENVNSIIGTASSNVLTGTGAPDWIEGLAGNDNIDGGPGNDVIIGGPGRDTMKGSAGDDTFVIEGSDTDYDSINGGDGLDKLTGGEGDDTFRFHNFSGENTVEEIDGGDGENVIAGTEGSNVIDLSGTSVLNIARIEGFGGNDNITGSAGDDLIIGGAGRDTMKGGEGDDTFLLAGTDIDYDSFNGGPGTDKLIGSLGDDTFRFHNFSGENTVEIIDGVDGEDTIAGTSGANVLDFSGTELLGSFRIFGFAGNDNITGSSGHDYIVAGAGRDTVRGEAGNDTFVHEGTEDEYDSFNGGDGLDELIGGIGDDTFRFHNFSGENRVEIINGGFGEDVIAGTNGANVIDLSGVQVVSIARIEGLDGNDNITGSNAADVIIGGAGRDTIRGGGGDDIFLHEGSDDPEYDTFSGGNGWDQLLGGDGDDIFRFHNFSGDNTVEVIDGGAGSNIIEGTSASNVIDLGGTVVMGIELIDGREGNDNITGTDGDDVIIGGSGRDTLKGMGGDDVFYLFHSDSEYDSVNGGDGFDRMLGEFGDEVFRFHNFSGDNTVELIDGGGGFNQVAGTDGSNVLDFSNTILVNITQIMGHAGNDNIKGSAGNDVIYGGAGQDTVNGGAGDDRYWFSLGDGNDTIDNRTAAVTDNDVLYLDDGAFDFSNLFFSKSGSDLVIRFFSSNESVRIKGALQNEQYRLDQIIHGNDVLSADNIDELVAALAGFAPESGTEFSEAQRIEIAGVISTFFEPLP